MSSITKLRLLTESEPEDSPELEIILMCGFIIQVLSAISCLIIIIISFILKFHKEQIGKMIIIFSFMQTVYALPLQQIIEGSILCTVIDFLNCYSLVSVSIWSACFTHHLVIALNYTKFNMKRLFIKYVVMAQGIPCIFAFLSVKLRFYQWSDEHRSCYHQLNMGEFDTKLLVSRLIPVFVLLVCAIVFYAVSLRKLRTLKEFMKRTKIDGTITILFIIPLINTIVWVPMIIILILVAAKAQVNDTLLNSMYLGTLGQGLISSIALGCSGKIRAGLRRTRTPSQISTNFTPQQESKETIHRKGTDQSVVAHASMDAIRTPLISENS